MAFPNPTLRAGLGAIALAVLALGADAPLQTINADGLTFKAPKSWKSQPSTEVRFRRAYLKVDPVPGDPEPAELVVTSLFDDGGGVEANVERWRNQFKDEADAAPQADVATRRGKNVEVTVVEIAGRYVAPRFPANPNGPRSNKPHFRMYGVIVPGKLGTFFLKMTGPDKTMKAVKPAFDDLVSSLTLSEP